MRLLLTLPLLALASPAAAQYYHPPVGPAPSTAGVPPQMMDPALPDQLGRMAGALTHAVMNLPVGEMQAAIEGRPVTPADRGRTVGSETRDRGMAEHDVQREVATNAGTVQRSARAIQQSLPAVQQALGQLMSSIERATANLPDPTYPRR